MADSEAAVCNLALLKIGHTKDLIDTLNVTTDQTDDASEQAQVCRIVYPQQRDNLLGRFKWPWAQRRAQPSQLGGDDWSSLTTYAKGNYVSFAPDQTLVANAPETGNTFVYLSLQDANTNHSPESSPTYWRQVSRPEFAFVFQIPSDVLQIHYLYGGIRNAREDEEIPYELASDPDPGSGTILLTDACLMGLVARTPAIIEIAYTAQITDPKQFPAEFTEALAWNIARELALALRKDADEAKRCDDAAQIEEARARVKAKKGIRKDPEPLPSWIARRGGRSG